MAEHRLAVKRRVRYFMRGEARAGLEQVWFACHGYGQLGASFLSDLAVLGGPRRLLVAPEALSRFYLDSPHRTVGASWMTREDRLNEIQDYVEYLDAIHGQVFSLLPRNSVRVFVLGFSQGAATVSRWVGRGRVQPDDLVLWGETLPPDIEEESMERLRTTHVTLVAGRRDAYLSEEKLQEQRRRLRFHGIPFEEIRFDGGHRLDDETLLRIASSRGRGSGGPLRPPG